MHDNYYGNTRGAVTSGEESGPGGTGGGERPWDAACHWLEHFWDMVIRETPQRVWRIGALTERDATFDLRDGLACVLVHRRLYRHIEIEEHYYTAWASEPARKPPQRHYFVIGRPHLYVGSEATDFLQPIAACAHARFEELPRSRTAAGLTYGEQRFFQDELDDGRRQIKRDYAVLMFRRLVVDGEEVCVVSIAGLSALATLALTHVLTDADELDQLVEQVRALLPPGCPARFDEAFEICVRIDVEKKDLQNFANERRFEFAVEVVTGGDAVFFRSDPVPLVLHPPRKGAKGSVVIGARQAKLSALRSLLMQRLIECPAGVPTEKLVDELYLTPKGLSLEGASGSAATREEINLAYRAVSKLVCVTNKELKEISPGWRPIEHIEGRYVLRARARIEDGG